MDKRHAEIFHARAGNSVLAWSSAGSDLLAAANVLKEKIDSYDLGAFTTGDSVPREALLGSVVLMLKGMAVECLLKAMWVKRGNVLVADGRYCRVPGARDHDLPQLAAAVNFNVNSTEVAVLCRLSLFIAAGRYPIPKSAATFGEAGTTWSSSDEGVFDELAHRLNALLEDTV